jgi:hypothetical protein
MSDSSFDYLGGNYYISAASLLLEYRMFIDSHPTLFKINAANPYWPKMVYFCNELEKFPEIMKAITRVHVNSQIDFERALFCSWCSLLIARSIGLSEQNQRLLFLAGLLQDIGKHVETDEKIDLPTEVNGPFFSQVSSTDARDMHPLLSARLVQRYLPELEGLEELVLHHHAKNDGTGFPNHIGETQLALDSQILIIANELSDRLDKLGGHNQIAQTLSNLRLNSFLYFERAHNHWLTLIEGHVSIPVRISNTENLFLEIEQKILELEKMLSCLLVVSAELLPFDFDLNVHGLRSMIHRLVRLSTDTGVFDPSLFRARTEDLIGKPLNEQSYNHKEVSECSVVCDIANILKGLPEILARMKALTDDILSSKKYDANYALVANANELLYKNIKLLEGNRCAIFR